jgi:rubrerythrin
MATLLYINEVINFAIERENESYTLYKELSETVADAEARHLFSVLMDEEQAHKTFYAAFLAAIDVHQQSPGVTEDDEYAAYMKTLIDSQRSVTTPPIDLANLAGVLDFAIAREKDAVLFYVGLEHFVPDDDRSTVRTIIKEEGSHIVKLTNLKRQLA